MAIIHTEEEIRAVRASGRVLAEIHEVLRAAIAPGVTCRELNELAEEEMRKRDAEPIFKGYRPSRAAVPFPAAICTSLNNEVVHGIPAVPIRRLQEGDIISVDAGVRVEGFITDAARTWPVGEVDKESARLLADTLQALEVGIAAARHKSYVGDIGYAIQSFAEPLGYGIVRELGGHGVGHKVHEEPSIPNFGAPDTGKRLEAGMVLAIEPMLNLGSPGVTFDEQDGYTVRTADGKRSAHFEDTILVTEGDPIILTRLQ